MSKVYQPVKCTNRECAFPKLQCEVCMCNQSKHGTHAKVIKKPQGMYKWLRKLYDQNNM